MIIALLAAAVLAPAPSGEPSPTAGELYDGCVRSVAQDRAAPDPDQLGLTCEITALTTLTLNAADTVLRESDPTRPDNRTFCLPENISQDLDGAGLQLARAFIAYVDRNPASRSAVADEVFDRAAAEKWPCPH